MNGVKIITSVKDFTSCTSATEKLLSHSKLNPSITKDKDNVIEAQNAAF